jgi:hypothetical protein
MERKPKDPDVRGSILSKAIPVEPDNTERRHIKRIMKSVQGPYPKFTAYYPLEEVIDLYMEIWYKDDSDSSY